jgi:hypothetical protein
MDPVQLFPGFMLADPSYVVTDLLICVFSFYEWGEPLFSAGLLTNF